MGSKSMVDIGYQQWLIKLKDKIRNSQLRAALKVNTELLSLYWEIGKELSEKQDQAGWGDKIITQLATDLRNEFPDMKGFSRSNIFNISKWYRFYSRLPKLVQQPVGLIKNSKKASGNQLVQQPVGQLPVVLSQVPWGHHIQIITKIHDPAEAIFYLHQTAINSWSRSVLLHQIDSDLFQRKGNAITNFNSTLPKTQSDLARETLKNPYIFDFLGLTEEIQERELERALIQHIKKFMLELGRGFAYVGNQYNLKVEGDEYYLDLLFFNFQLDCFVVFELKVGEFKPEFAGKLNFYINTIDEQIRGAQHKPTIGVLLCKTPNDTVVKYALKGIKTPMGVSEYELTKALPKQLKAEMPTIKELEHEIEKETIEFQEHLNPVDARLKVIKEKIKGISNEEIQTVATHSILLNLYYEGIKPLYQDIIKKLSEFNEYFHTSSFVWNATNFNTNNLDQVDKLWDNEESLKGVREMNFSCNFIGFKKAGTENYAEYLTLKFEIQDYWYGFTLVNHNNQQPFLKKLYHQPITTNDRQQVIDLLLSKMMDRIDWIIDRLDNSISN